MRKSTRPGETAEMTEAFSKVVDLAQALGVYAINELDGCWEYRVSDKWLLKVNGHAVEVDGIPAYHASATYNGWPAGVFSPVGGTIAGGQGANEDTLIAALDEAIEAAKVFPPGNP